MVRKGNWFSNVKKALSPESKERKDQKSSKSKKKWFGKQKLQTSDTYSETDKAVAPPLPPPEEIILTHIENENGHVHVEIPTAVEAEEPVPAVQTAAPEIQAITVVQSACKPNDQVAATKIQTAFRGYMARRALRALRGLVRLRSLMEGSVVKRQAVSALRSMQTLSHVQSQIRSRRLRMLEENQALQKQLLQKHTKELESLRIGEEWDDSQQSKEQIEAKLLSKYEAAMRRERAMAYSFTHQDIEARIHCAEWLSIVGGSSIGEQRIRMPRHKRFYRRVQSTPTQTDANASINSEGASHRSPLSEPIAQSFPPVPPQVEEQSDLPISSSSTSQRKSSKFWTVDVIDVEGVVKEERLTIDKLMVLPIGKKVVLDWNEKVQPIGEAGGLLGTFLGKLVTNCSYFPISYDTWHKVPKSLKDHVWTTTIMEKFQVNEEHKKYMFESIGKKWRDNRGTLYDAFYMEDASWQRNVEEHPEGVPREQWASFLAYRLSEKTKEMCAKNAENRAKQTIPRTLGSKSLARKRHEMEMDEGRPYNRAEMYTISHKKQDGFFVTVEAKQKSDELDMHCEELDMSDEEAYKAVFGKEHTRRVRGMGMGVCPSQVFGTSYRRSTMPTSSNSAIEELKSQLEARDAKMKAMEEENNAKLKAMEEENNAKFKALEAKMTFMMHNIGSQFGGECPRSRVNEDGPQTGQTVPHVHIHILPWKSGDFENNDDIYDEKNKKEKEMNRELQVDIERRERSIEEMAQEAAEYKKLVF